MMMMMKKVYAGFAVLAAMMAAPAFAADMAVKAPPMAPAPAFDWSGFYVGGDLGWQGSRIGLSSGLAGATLSYAENHDSFAGGAFLGAQKQFGQYVLGIEGSYLAASGNASLGATPSSSIFFPGGTGTGQVKLRDIVSIGGRFGWALGQWMPYLTGGYANGAFEFDQQNNPAFGTSTELAKSYNVGGYAGAGIDYALSRNWIVGAEYRHYAFRTTSATALRTDGFTEPVNFATRTDTVMARLSYKFDWMTH